MRYLLAFVLAYTIISSCKFIPSPPPGGTPPDSTGTPPDTVVAPPDTTKPPEPPNDEQKPDTTDFSTGFGSFNRSLHAGERSEITGGACVLKSTGATSGWIHSKGEYDWDEMAFTVRVNPSADFCIGVAPEGAPLDSRNTSGFYEHDHIRFYVWRDLPNGGYSLFYHARSEAQVHDVLISPVIVEPGEFYDMRMEFVGDSLYFYWQWKEVWRARKPFESRQVWLEAASYNSEYRGASVLDMAVIMAPEIEEPEEPPSSAYYEYKVMWNPVTTRMSGRTLPRDSLLGYRVWVYDHLYKEDISAYVFSNAESLKIVTASEYLNISVTALDVENKESAHSDTVFAKGSIKRE